MADWLNSLIENSNSYMPHGACYLWQPAVVWLHVISDTLIVLAYYSIPFALMYFVYNRADLVYRWVFVLFGAFIMLCGTTHLLSIWTIWHPDYWLEGLVKLATALVSVVTAVLIWPLIPKLLKLPSPASLKASETYMRAIFDATPDAMLISDEQGIITMVNHQCESLLGYQAEQLVGQSIEILVPETIRPNHVKSRAQFNAKPSVKAMGAGRVVKARKRDNSEFDVEISLSPIQTEKGMLFASALRDITQRKRMEDELRASEERFRRMSNASPAMIWITDVNGKPTFVNQTWLDFVGINFEQAISYESWIQFIHPDDRESVFAEYYKNVFDQKPIVTEYRMRRTQGDWRWILDHGVPIYDEKGVFAGYIGSAFDITERKQAEADFRIAATAFESQEAMVITDANAVILRVNKTFTESTGYSAEEAVGQNISILKSGRHDQDFYADMWRSLKNTGTWQGEIWDKRKNDQIYPKWLTITAVKDETGAVTHYVGTHIDISDRKAAEDEIKNLAFYDPLTQLPNRRLLLDRLQQALATHARKQVFGALFFLDLDHFKNLNDTLGHEKGDQLLQQVAGRLSSCVREGDTVARLGGDEFVVMLKELGARSAEAAVQAEMIGEKILRTLNETYQFDGYEHRSTSSIGATLFSDQSLGIDELLKQADIAMYQAKAAGRNNLRFFDPAMQASIIARTAMEQALHEALNAKQFRIFYQPQVDAEGRIYGAEALLRWEHPTQGMVSPASFIPLAEETGLILPLGHCVLENTCEQLVKWASLPGMAHLTIAVNVSIRQFRQDDFADQVLAILAKAGANPARLKLELTESILALDLQDIKSKMTRLKAQGVTFSLDDFGTGYSSLAYLKQLPLDQLKIDQSFVRDILNDVNDEAIAKMIIALAASMGLQVIAEGVETTLQKDKLLDLGCANYQGYLFSRPVAIDEFEALINSR
ncbi:sensor domain-containing protein [Methylomonas methanica]|uniref:cyclic-guanylate-specific phosphodiesterase n=1 Tax=Methylomonas methanica (strain DSM 25384 / MC09) TaxID=857087 RepID=F9ZVN1_METMM|nr:bifunctional diguanylate cyclase/phosphodiesterase [Methylomonas methanica]AEF99509.1 diguanylate cyclase/phosphodiesterase with PAS/PAC sensor(s) [Methylomonas methanica MC09]